MRGDWLEDISPSPATIQRKLPAPPAFETGRGTLHNAIILAYESGYPIPIAKATG
jgi:hypothetical protein